MSRGRSGGMLCLHGGPGAALVTDIGNALNGCSRAGNPAKSSEMLTRAAAACALDRGGGGRTPGGGG